MTVSGVLLRILGLVILGAIGSGTAVVAASLSPKALIAVLGAATVIGVMVATGRPREVLLAAYIVALSYNRQYFSFDELLGTSGTQSPYWLPSDPILLLLFLSSLVTRADQRQPLNRDVPFAIGVWPVLPFLAVCCLSTLLAVRPDWAFHDTLRVAKFALLLAWLHVNMTRSLWLTAVFTFIAVAGAQSALGIVQVVLKGDASLLAMAGLSEGVKSAATEIENRARGTFGHPNLLAPWLLTIIPAVFGVALFARDRLLVLLCLVVTALGCLGVFASKSRAPTVLLAVGLVLVALAAVRLRALPVRRATGGAILALGLVTAAALPLMNDILDRLQGDFSTSVEFRSEYNRAGIAIWNDHPWLGIGPNNVNAEIGLHVPWLEALVKDAEQYRDIGNVRIATIHNVYVLILTETGLIGLPMFLLLLAVPVWRSIRAAALTDGAIRGGAVGLAAGLLVSYAQQTVDFSLWYDASWFSFAIQIALVTAAPKLMEPSAPDRA